MREWEGTCLRVQKISASSHGRQTNGVISEFRSSSPLGVSHSCLPSQLLSHLRGNKSRRGRLSVPIFPYNGVDEVLVGDEKWRSRGIIFGESTAWVARHWATGAGAQWVRGRYWGSRDAAADGAGCVGCILRALHACTQCSHHVCVGSALIIPFSPGRKLRCRELVHREP